MTIAEENWISESEKKAKVFGVGDRFDNRSQSASNIPELVVGPRRPSTLKLFGSSRRVRDSNDSVVPPESADSLDENSRVPVTRLIEDMVREFEESYKSPTEIDTPSKKSMNFVKRLVAAFERRQRDVEVENGFAKEKKRNEEEILSQKNPSGGDENQEEWKNRKNQSVVSKVADPAEEEDEGEEEPEPRPKTAPKVVGAFLKKPIEIQRTPVYWIPITASKKLPRAKSFKRFLAKLTGRGGGGKAGRNGEGKGKQVVFASQENLIEEIHDSGYEGRSSSGSSLASFADTLMYQDELYVDRAYRDCNFSTFVTSSPVKKTSSRFVQEETFEEEGDEILSKDLVATRVRQINYQLAKLPKHPFARSEPRLCGRGEEGRRPSSEEIIILRGKNREEPVYDIPKPRPRSSIFDESFSIRRRNVPVQSVAPLEKSERPVFFRQESDEDEPHYATVRPRSLKISHVSYDNLWKNGVDESSDEPVQTEKISSKSHSFADLTANESFVITMYV